MTKKFYAHSLPDKPPDEWQCLDKHLEAVASKAEAFAATFDSAAWAKAAGILHDLGKAHPDFQAYLFRENGLNASEYDDQSTGSRVKHSGVGAIVAYEKWHNIIGKTLAYLVAGHHAGLPDWFGGADSLAHRLKHEKPIMEKIGTEVDAYLKELPSVLCPPISFKPEAFHLWVRMLYSCLVDADFLDTEAFMDAAKHALRPPFPLLSELKTRFDQKLNEKVTIAPDISINAVRANILAACRAAAEHKPGLFSLTVPTGGGKTLSCTAFALDHAIQHGKSRIIYVIPYTSIIEHTADVLRKFFGAGNVVEHHSNIAAEREKEAPQLTLAAENWDAPVIVTTSVQFFESLYAAKPGRCRKLHNIVNSVVILDEAQLLPPELLYPCVESLNRLVSDYGVTVVLSTATQPALPNLCQKPQEIISDPARLYVELKRTNIIFPNNLNEPRDWLSLARELADYDQVLCIVNTRPDCHDLWKEMPEGTIHLSALMCGEHRSQVIAEIKARLVRGETCRVISTQLVEAGVDMDFPVVYRALAGLDSINQAAGRCNREGESPDPGEVHVFIAPKPAPPGLLRKGEDATRELSSIPGFAPETPDAFRHYFERYYSSINDNGENWWREKLVRDVNPDGNVQFRTAGKEFSLIKDPSVTVIIRYGGNDDLITRLRFAGPTREIMRELQRYTVSIKPSIATRLAAEGRIEELHDGILVQADSMLYSPNIGLNIYQETYNPEDLLI